MYIEIPYKHIRSTRLANDVTADGGATLALCNKAMKTLAVGTSRESRSCGAMFRVKCHGHFMFSHAAT
jgi:hypothetical protein